VEEVEIDKEDQFHVNKVEIKSVSILDGNTVQNFEIP
jgi:hypothetical protein